MTWRVAKSLLTLREQVNAKWPNRDKDSDGTIGDASHSARASDHNPDDNGVVRAMDITHDPKHGCDSYELAEILRQNRDPRVKYIISNRRIANSTQSPWVWRQYNGSNAHDRHMHLSVVSGASADDTRSWDIDRHSAPAPIPRPVPAPLDIGRFAACMQGLALHEGGRDDDPQDHGGRTGYGVTQSEWDRWRETHHGLPVDVWNAPRSQVQALFRQWYWDVLDCDRLPIGIDYCIFDYGVNSGVEKSARMLQKLLDVGVDGHIGPITEAAAARANGAILINDLCDARMAYLRTRDNWDHFQHGWTTRVADVRRDALAALSKHS